MNFLEILVIAIGLSMDAFAVSICKGLSIRKIEWKHVALVALWFGGFQALMPAVGYLLGSISGSITVSRFLSRGRFHGSRLHG